MGIVKVLVPPRPGLLSAIGLLHADVRGDFSLTRLTRAAPENLRTLNRGFEELKRRGANWLEGEGEARADFNWFADLRYTGQNYELNMELKGGSLDETALSRLVNSFHHRHQDSYGYEMRGQPVEVVNLRLVVAAKRRTPPHESIRMKQGDPRQALLERRRVWFPETGFVTAPVYDRDQLPAGCRITGPAVIEQMDTTTVVPPKARLKSGRFGYLHLELARVKQKRGATWAAA
jgi:N-methylhydantoinase A